MLDTFDGRLAAAGCRLTASVSDAGPTELVLTATGGADVVVTVEEGDAVGGERSPGGRPTGPDSPTSLEVRALLPLLTTDVLRSDAVLRQRGP